MINLTNEQVVAYLVAKGWKELEVPNSNLRKWKSPTRRTYAWLVRDGQERYAGQERELLEEALRKIGQYEARSPTYVIGSIQMINASDDEVKLKLSEGRDSKGRFAPGNKIVGDANVKGVRGKDIRQHRSAINEYIPEIIRILIDEAVNNRNIAICQWLVGRIVPETKNATFADTKLINKIGTLTELQEQAVQTIKEGVEGEASLEETNMLLGAYKDHKTLIEGAQIDPLVKALSDRMGRSYGQ